MVNINRFGLTHGPRPARLMPIQVSIRHDRGFDTHGMAALLRAIDAEATAGAAADRGDSVAEQYPIGPPPARASLLSPAPRRAMRPRHELFHFVSPDIYD